MSDVNTKDEPATTEERFRRLTPFWKWLLIALSVTSIIFSGYQVFNLGMYTGYVPIENQYFYVIVALLLPTAFIVFPISGKAAHGGMTWYDVVLFLATAAICLVFVYYSIDMLDEGWEFSAPENMQWLSLLLVLLAIEAVRRTGGGIVTFIIVIFAIYPLFAGEMPGVLEGTTESLLDTVAYYALSTEALIGIPTRAFAGLVIGFLLFGVALQYTGGGQFFLNLAFALLGHVRGGPAKVAIFASGLMGSMSGSVITNVLTTGSLSIPAMKRIGFQPHVAGGVEACASTGGVLMPPIMGATAFIMAINLEVPYRDIVVAAVIPSVLYFFALFMQIDGYAARNKLEGLPKIELPTVRQTLKDGWYYVAVFALLIYLLVFMQREAQAPFYATILLLVINQTHPKHRWNWDRFVEFLVATGRLFAELAAILVGIGLIVGSLSYSGKIGTLAFELLQLAGNNVALLLMLGALASFIMGIGVTVTVAYIILALTLAPALTDSGLSAMGVHMFMLYWGMLSYITPPVALGSFAAASLAQANPMRTGFESMKLGTIIYFVPFFFVLDPGLIMQGEPLHILTVFGCAVLGVIVLSTSLQGYLYGVGDLTLMGLVQWPIRFGLMIGALAFAMPGNDVIGMNNMELFIAGIVFTGAAAILALTTKKVLAPG
ncbi:TRAP transporter fused permease subunit [Rhodospirillaceae bacterium]|nr:TRAP transporter fused permease subunit [Rhodospirillaceae bacterium]MBT6307401.1 TRAP transporter fused permease subunit [Rhodospirillaceae bacterium]MDC1441303.1 TRAP transporter fused permease subunit [Rhodospirillaceae bacterium]MDG1275268.1 TRAP transporter fused permease subunit [Alphaproteobacteria bacterium]MDG1887987.1 TRAP transporter fused permease subunit [Alphaproteobacteria bacterium]